MLFLFAIRYRETNPKAKMTYAPHLTGNIKLELLWWGIPSAIILLLSVVTWNTSHSLDPHRALTSSKQPLKIQVIALDWKWLFIYPDENVASINEVEFPVNTPVEFNITADAPMNSLWIPQLGSQIYAMPGMATKLNLMATKLGTYSGSSANVSGAGFSDMRFNAVSVTDSDYEMWLARAQSSSGTLSEGEYAKLVRPSENVPVRQYSSVSSNLFQNVLLKYMAPGGPQ
jgi:cytochrome o ubiquinol oxidase subunit 2